MNADEIERYVDAAAAALALPLHDEHRPGVLRYFALAAGMAGQVMAEPLGTSDEPAFVFLPVAPEDLPADAAEAIRPASEPDPEPGP